jgi:hypothetical protein
MSIVTLGHRKRLFHEIRTVRLKYSGAIALGLAQTGSGGGGGEENSVAEGGRALSAIRTFQQMHTCQKSKNIVFDFLSDASQKVNLFTNL